MIQFAVAVAVDRNNAREGGKLGHVPISAKIIKRMRSEFRPSIDCDTL
jgi:hypothetical protein